MGGFDENRFSVVHDDVEFCQRLPQRGLRSVYAARAELIHYEGQPRGFVDNLHEGLTCRRLVTPDPYYNPNLSLEHDQFAISPRRATTDLRAADRPINVLLVSHNLNREGASLFMYELALGLTRRGRLALEVFSPVDGPLGDLYREVDIPVHVLTPPTANATTGEQFNVAARTFAVWMQDMRFQAVHANTLFAFYAVAAARHAGLPSVWSVHESDWQTYFQHFGPVLTAEAIECFRLPYQVAFAADATRALFEPLNTHHNFAVQHYGLKRDAIDRLLRTCSPAEAKSRIGCPSGHTVITIIGTTCERKGQADFVAAAVRILQAGARDLSFYLVGCRTGPYLDALKEAAAGHTGSIHFVAETEEAHVYYRASDLFVCCSYNESFPRVVLEAMAFRLAIVTTPVFGIAEQVKHEVSALMYDPGDVSTLAGHMNRLRLDPSERQRLGHGAYAALEALAGFEEMTANYERFLLEAFVASGKPVTPTLSAAILSDDVSIPAAA
jgi:glycosyltransferase involved in cell wall biosynthesis